VNDTFVTTLVISDVVVPDEEVILAVPDEVILTVLDVVMLIGV